MGTRSVRFLGKLVALAGCFAVVQCSTTPTPSVGADAGAIVASVTHGTKQVGSRDQHAWFYISQDGSKERIRLESHGVSLFWQSNDFKGDPRQTGRVEVRHLAAGTYAISGWTLYVTSGAGYTYLNSEHFAPRTFEVSAGKITYLGNLNLDVIVGKNLLHLPIEAGATATIADRQSRDMPIAFKKDPSIVGWETIDVAGELSHAPPAAAEPANATDQAMGH